MGYGNLNAGSHGESNGTHHSTIGLESRRSVVDNSFHSVDFVFSFRFQRIHIHPDIHSSSTTIEILEVAIGNLGISRVRGLVIGHCEL